MCQKEGFKRIEKKDSQQCTEIAYMRMNHFISLLSLFPPFASYLWTADRQDSAYSTTRKQTIDYIRYISNKNPLGRQGIAHTLAHVHSCIHRLQERVSYCQKTMEAGWLSYNSLLHCYQFAYVILIQLIWPALQTWNDGKCFLSVSLQRSIWLRKVFRLKWTTQGSPKDKITIILILQT